MNLVFDDPQHANGGCIFADPSVVISPTSPVVGRGGGGGLPVRKGRSEPIVEPRHREEEEIIMAFVAAFLEVVE